MSRSKPQITDLAEPAIWEADSLGCVLHPEPTMLVVSRRL